MAFHACCHSSNNHLKHGDINKTGYKKQVLDDCFNSHMFIGFLDGFNIKRENIGTVCISAEGQMLNLGGGLYN